MAVFNLAGAEISEAYDLSGESLDDVFDIDGERIGMDHEPEFNDPVTVTLLSNATFEGTMQGACTDGEYIYAVVLSRTIIKYKISDGTFTSTDIPGTTPVFSHANDATYNPNEGRIYICSMLSDGSIFSLNASDLSYVETIYLKDGNNNAITVWQFCYDRIRDCYYVSQGSKMLVYDSNWDYVREFDMYPHPDATGQGCDTDGTYIYRVTSSPALVDVTTMDGQHVATLDRSGGGETETMICDWNGNYYTNMNWTTGKFFRLNLFAE